MPHRPVVRRILLAGAVLALLVLAGGAISGGLRQIPRANTPGRQLETAVQLACGVLAVLAVVTCFRLRRWAVPVRAAWAVSFALTVGLSSQAPSLDWAELAWLDVIRT